MHLGNPLRTRSFPLTKQAPVILFHWELCLKNFDLLVAMLQLSCSAFS